MLRTLTIRDFAIVEAEELHFGPGMTAITGETGAGKSILLDALGLLLGDRADSQSVRYGTDRADLVAEFDLTDRHEARLWLSERDLDLGDTCLLRRVIGRDGRSRAYINGTPQPLQALRELGEMLVDLHGQHEHQSLLQREAQRQWLDQAGGLTGALERVEARHQIWKSRVDEHQHLQVEAHARNERLDLLRYQIGELESLGLQTDEPDRLAAEHQRLSQAGRLLEVSQTALGQLYEDERQSVCSRLGRIVQQLAGLCSIDLSLRPLVESLDAARIQIEDASSELRRYVHSLDLDPRRLATVEERLYAMIALARKHRVEAAELPGLLERLTAERDRLQAIDHRLEHLEQGIDEALAAYDEAAAELGAARSAAAPRLAERVSHLLADLGMPGARFGIHLSALDVPGPHGRELVEFELQSNPGEAARPLAKVASGGELSRLSLVLQVIVAGGNGVPTLVFDEVDAGIGGGVAEAIGQRLRALGQHRQVLCVTHLPQVASQAHQHLRVIKHVDDDRTRTRVETLGEAGRVEEIGRMLGGQELTAPTLEHARDMLDRARSAAIAA